MSAVLIYCGQEIAFRVSGCMVLWRGGRIETHSLSSIQPVFCFVTIDRTTSSFIAFHCEGITVRMTGSLIYLPTPLPSPRDLTSHLFIITTTPQLSSTPLSAAIRLPTTKSLQASPGQLDWIFRCPVIS